MPNLEELNKWFDLVLEQRANEIDIEEEEEKLQVKQNAKKKKNQNLYGTFNKNNETFYYIFIN